MQTSTRQLAAGGIFLGLTVLVGVFSYLAAGWSLLDSIYMVVITIFGVGYGEVRPIESSHLRIFTIVLIFSGCSCLIFMIGAVIQFLTEGQIQRALGKRRMEKEIKHLEGHVIVCGFGRIGRLIAEEMSKAHRDFIVVERDNAKSKEIRELNYLHLHGDAVDENALIAAGIQRAAILASVLSDDASNVFVTLSARNLNPKLTIIARGDIPSTEHKLRQAGADKVVLPIHIGADRISSMILHPGVEEFVAGKLLSSDMTLQMEELGLGVEQISISEGSPLVGKQLDSLETREKCAFLIVAVRKADGSVVTRPPLSLQIESGDHLIVMCHRGTAPEFVHRHGVKREMYYRGVRVAD